MTARPTTAERAESSFARYAPGLPHQDVPALTGLRFVAAFCVLVAHGVSMMLAEHETPLGAIYWLRQASGFGMTLFFVLSGFVIHYNYAALVSSGRLCGIGAYLWARFARLYPLFLLTLLGYIVVSNKHFEFWAGNPERFISVLHALPYFLLSIQSWFYTAIDDRSLIYAVGPSPSVTWSISTEWFFYFIYPCIAWVILRARTPLVTAAGAGLWCAFWIAISTSLYERSPQIDAWAVERFGSIAGMQEHQSDSFIRWLLYFSPYLRIGEFVLGAFIAQLYLQLRNQKIIAWENSIGTMVFFTGAASVVLITYLEYSPDVGMNVFREMSMNFALAPTAALVIFCGARYRNVASRALTSRPAIALGDASYSIYLVHFGVLLCVVALTGSAAHGVAFDTVKLVLVMAAIILISMLLYAYYEAPARKWLRQRWGNTPSVASRGVQSAAP